MTAPRKAFDEIDLLFTSNSSSSMLGADSNCDDITNEIDDEKRIQLESLGEVESCFVPQDQMAGSNHSSDAKILSPLALARLITYAIELKGPTRVGELGKFLQLATGNESIVLFIKMQLKGLKNLIQGFSGLFRLGNDHPFNPTVYLTDAYTTTANALRVRARQELLPFYSYDSNILQPSPIVGLNPAHEGERVSDLSDTSGTTRSRSRSNSTDGLDGSYSNPSRLSGGSRDASLGTFDTHTDTASQLQASAEALAQNIVLILEEKGPLPVGEIGKFLQLYTASGNEMSHFIKTQFRGLRKLIAGFRRLFTMDQSHPFNPCVHLSAEYMSYSDVERSTADLSPLFVFEPVVTIPSTTPISPDDKFSSGNASAMLKTAQKNCAGKLKKVKKPSPAGKSKGVQGKHAQGQLQWVTRHNDGHQAWQGQNGYAQSSGRTSQFYQYGQQYPTPSSGTSHNSYSEDYPDLPSSNPYPSDGAESSFTPGGSASGWMGHARVRSRALGCDAPSSDASSIPSSWSAYKASVKSTAGVAVPTTDSSSKDNRMASMESYVADMRIPDNYFAGSPDDSKQMMCMSPNYIKYSHILNMLDIE
eukprot:CAMPEP_0185022292 /NCGR_PEP_ID=MMETSP1103-20130426/5002_1 /TAXON_ID=36769 /ORGANISM="Paraphysomonas bandaiensis, Strain Caron Lab Isolate" /LENGTH=588 /DNA_ID=CAMNT_0027554291 /DNA_START=32 /DNA_END=1798 /DNA_ORIENTATION=+